MNVYNLVSLSGRLTADPELKTTQSGISNCRICIAVNRPYQKDKEQEADFINVVAWRQTAEFICKYFQKGSPITVIGSMRNNNYTDSNGVKHYAMDVQADNVGFAIKNSSDNVSASAAGYAFADPPKSAVSTANQESAAIGGLEDFEEILSDGEVPF
jgi:single-strand DNA-binding protein